MRGLGSVNPCSSPAAVGGGAVSPIESIPVGLNY